MSTAERTVEKVRADQNELRHQIEALKEEIAEAKAHLTVEQRLANACFAALNERLAGLETQLAELRKQETILLQKHSSSPVESDLMERFAKLETRVRTCTDQRLYYFSEAMPGSSGRHTIASEFIRKEYGGQCVVCGDGNATMAHLVASRHDVDYRPFSRPRYKDDFDPKSPRNFLPLCGTKGVYGTCHHEFDTYKMTINYNPFKKSFVVFCLDPDFPKYKDVHGKDIAVSATEVPYRRVLAWRTRKCATEHPYLLPDGGASLLDFANFSEESHSMKCSEPGSEEATEIDEIH